jgi:colanic acid/amylovoran biosynthesis glycosyltransferase
VRVAYLIGRYPAISHTFILREVAALREQDVEVETVSVGRTPKEDLLSEADREEARRTSVLLPPSPIATLLAHASALRHSAGAYTRALTLAFALSRPGLRGRLLGLSWFIEAMLLWRLCRRKRIRHVHAHLNGTAPAVALLTADFANAAGGDGRWTWSMTVHGPAEFYDVVGESLAAKVERASFIVCVSDFARSQLMALVDEHHWDKLHVVHCGVPARLFADSSSSHGTVSDGRPLRVLSVGRLTRIKGQTVLLAAASQLRERGWAIEVTVVGDGPTRAALEGVVRERGLSDSVRFTGAVGLDAMPAIYGTADVFCLSSFAEGVPVVLMEAMAAGLPVVASNVMGVGELVEHEVSGLLVRPGRSSAIATALEELAMAPEQRREMGGKGRAKVLADFNVQDSAEKLRVLFATVAS